MPLGPAGVLILFALGGAVAEGPPLGCPNLTIEARYVGMPEPSLVFDVHTDQPCTMYSAELPWGNFYSVQLRIRDASGAVCSSHIVPIDDPSAHVISLKPGEPVSGRVRLTPHCPAVAALVSSGRVTVDWKYTPVGRRSDTARPKGRIVIAPNR